MAERKRFELLVPRGITGFQDQLHKPLGHLSLQDEIYFIIKGIRLSRDSKKILKNCAKAQKKIKTKRVNKIDSFPDRHFTFMGKNAIIILQELSKLTINSQTEESSNDDRVKGQRYAD